ncbi:MAG: PEP-CTERM sorting domain-containing protein [Sphaerospermopsis sp. SIO1G1]|nr:PEP-CTERM sorting domain-containing protein [Sphaerospermopsis sp. SIO1G1]
MLKSILQKTVFATTSAVVICATATTNSAQAVQLHYDFTGSGGNRNSFEFTSHDVDVTVTAYSQLSPFIPAKVRQTRHGLGIKSSRFDTDKKEIDGFGPDESLLLDFAPKNVRLLSATFGRVGFNDEFSLFVDGDHLISRNIPGGNRRDKDTGTFNFERFSGTTGSQFRFTVTDFNDDYTLKKAVFQTVPEPASILGLFAVAGLATSGLKLKRKSIV